MSEGHLRIWTKGLESWAIDRLTIRRLSIYAYMNIWDNLLDSHVRNYFRGQDEFLFHSGLMRLYNPMSIDYRATFKSGLTGFMALCQLQGIKPIIVI